MVNKYIISGKKQAHKKRHPIGYRFQSIQQSLMQRSIIAEAVCHKLFDSNLYFGKYSVLGIGIDVADALALCLDDAF